MRDEKTQECFWRVVLYANALVLKFPVYKHVDYVPHRMGVLQCPRTVTGDRQTAGPVDSEPDSTGNRYQLDKLPLSKSITPSK